MKTEILTVERDRATEALRESEGRYKRLLAATTAYTYTVNLEQGQTRSTYHGPGCEAVTGYAPDDYDKDPYLWYRIIHEDDRPAVLRQVDKILQGKLPPPLEHRIIHRDGSLRWIRNTTIPHYNVGGRLIGYDGLIADITERKLSEEALEHEHNLIARKPGTPCAGHPGQQRRDLGLEHRHRRGLLLPALEEHARLR